MNILNKVTRKALGRNRMRTFVTIIGIVLSAAMFTAVTTSITSMQNYMKKCCEQTDGSWYARYNMADNSKLSEIRSDSDVSRVETLEMIGYADIKSNNEYKPYLYIGGMSENFTDIVAVNMIEGKLPQNSGEIILPKHLITNGGNKDYNIGDKITLDVGQRSYGGSVLSQQNSYYAYEEGDEKGDEEKLINTGTREYTIVGFYERPAFEPYSAPGYTALTVGDGSDAAVYDVFYKTKKAGTIYTTAQRLNPDGESTVYNSDYLRFSGVSSNMAFNSVLYSFAGILMALIMFGSISLIYNAFSISVSERTRQFGILKSVGATKRQMRHSVMYEGMLLSIIGIPVGIGAGILGMFITFKCTGKFFGMMLVNGVDVTFGLHITWQALVIAAVVCLVTVMISANIPAVRAARKPAIEAIRQTNDVNIRKNKIKTSKLTYRLFGFEGMLASKNFKRNRKKYRATVLSLFMSIVLFISASGFCNYLMKGVDVANTTYNYDISYYVTRDLLNRKDLDKDSIEELLKSVQDVTDVTYIYNLDEYSFDVDKSLLTQKVLDITDDSMDRWSLRLAFVEDSDYRNYLKKMNLDEDTYMNTDEPVGVIYNEITIYSKKYYKTELFNTDKLSLTADNGESTIKLNIGASADETPMGIVQDGVSYPVVMYPFSAYDKIIPDEAYQLNYYIKSDNHKLSYEKMCDLLDSEGLASYRANDYSESVAVTKAMTMVVKVFSMGFIVLISLISLANVFNTISTNVALRRREFAMLKSVGMTKKGFYRMMNYECILYGVKGVALGLPVSLVINLLMARSIGFGVDIGVQIPWKSVIIAVGSVFLVVFATMIYSMSKIRNDNPVETLKNENL
ncbi:MAG: FtsX-like permease family protein [Lachnospiraceae bacterium]|nr:FtsX-like permease family protein [Lachnospiraceae bacterium]